MGFKKTIGVILLGMSLALGSFFKVNPQQLLPN